MLTRFRAAKTLKKPMIKLINTMCLSKFLEHQIDMITFAYSYSTPLENLEI